LIHSVQHDVQILLSNVWRFSRHGWESSFPLPLRPRGCSGQAGLSNLLSPMKNNLGWWKDNVDLPEKVQAKEQVIWWIPPMSPQLLISTLFVIYSGLQRGLGLWGTPL